MVQLHKRFTDEQIRESGGFGCKAAAKLNQRSAGQIIVIFVDVQRILPKNIETEFAQIVRFLQQAQSQQSGNAEIGAASLAIKKRVFLLPHK